MTNRILLNFHEEIQGVLMPSVVGFLLQGRINDFYKEYAVRLKSLDDKIIALYKEHYEFENDKIKEQEVLREQNINGEIKQIPEKKAILLPGKTEEEFKQKMNELMSAPISHGSKIITMR